MPGQWEGKRPSEEELERILEEHRVWFDSGGLGQRADLEGADLRGVKLNWVDLRGAFLSRVDFADSDLTGVDLLEAHAVGANFEGADLVAANLTRTNLSYANFDQVKIGHTLFTDIDLSYVKNLKYVEHIFPSTVGIDTLLKSKGDIPESFLRGCGIPQNLIDIIKSLDIKKVINDFCFISHSAKDSEFVDLLFQDLQGLEIGTWYAPRHMKTGDWNLDSIIRAINECDKFLVVISENSIGSNWVDTEVKLSIDRYMQQSKPAIIPIRIDNAHKCDSRAWIQFMRSHHIRDFTDWQDPNKFRQSFDDLLHDLNAAAPPD